MFGHFSFHTDQLPGSRALISASGELDIHSAAQLRQAIARAARRGARQLVLDFSRVTFMDSTTLHILAAEQRASENNLHLVVRAPQIRRLLKITGHERVLPLYKTLDDALRVSGQAQGVRDREAAHGGEAAA